MGPIDLLIHLLNFVAPAVALAVLLAGAGRALLGRESALLGWWFQVAVNAGVGVLVLTGGLWLFGRDGKMATYTALVVAAAASQWLLLRGWRK